MELDDIEDICIEIFNELKTGFNEVVYQKALELELRMIGIMYESEKIIPIIYKKHQIGIGRADIILNDEIIIELKAIGNLNGNGKEVNQLNNYLKFTGLKKGILINFNQSSGVLDCKQINLEE